MNDINYGNMDSRPGFGCFNEKDKQQAMTKELFIKRISETFGIFPDEKQALINDINSIIAQAIAEHEAAKWKKYPGNYPDINRIYLTELKNGSYRLNMWFTEWIGCKTVIAFRELPEPYKEGGEG